MHYVLPVSYPLNIRIYIWIDNETFYPYYVVDSQIVKKEY